MFFQIAIFLKTISAVFAGFYCELKISGSAGASSHHWAPWLNLKQREEIESASGHDCTYVKSTEEYGQVANAANAANAFQCFPYSE